MRVRWSMIGLALGLLLCSAPGAWSRESPFASDNPDKVEDAMKRYSLNLAFDKLGRGVTNLLFGWLEIPSTIQKRYNTTDTGTSLLMGAVIGLFRGLMRTGVGAYETVTFLLPYPEDFAPIMPSLDYFDSGQRKSLPLE